MRPSGCHAEHFVKSGTLKCADCCGRVLQKLEARLGVSTGKAVAGVKGVLQPRFTVLGVFIVGCRACDARE